MVLTLIKKFFPVGPRKLGKVFLKIGHLQINLPLQIKTFISLFLEILIKPFLLEENFIFLKLIFHHEKWAEF
jgi:hypothetical protein